MPGVKGKTNGKPFTKGDPRCGRPKMPDDMRGIKKLNKTVFVTSANKFLNMTRDEITAVLQDPDASMIDLMLGSIIAKAVKDSDTVRANFILDRLIPRVASTDESDLTLNMSTVQDAATDKAPFYVVEINQGGKFLRARPRELRLEERREAEIIAVKIKDNG